MLCLFTTLYLRSGFMSNATPPNPLHRLWGSSVHTYSSISSSIFLSAGLHHVSHSPSISVCSFSFWTMFNLPFSPRMLYDLILRPIWLLVWPVIIFPSLLRSRVLALFLCFYFRRFGHFLLDYLPLSSGRHLFRYSLVSFFDLLGLLGFQRIGRSMGCVLV